MIRLATIATATFALAACGSVAGPLTDGGVAVDGGAVTDGGGAQCALQANTTSSGSASPSGCARLTRDTSGCEAARIAAGLSGTWLKFSCRVALSKSASVVTAISDGQPDTRSNYFATTNACWESYTAAVQNPNLIGVSAYSLSFPITPTATAEAMRGGVVGLALNGVTIFGNFAGPGDDIFNEAATFDRCGAHPQQSGTYHYHGEPYAISYDDSRFIGVMRDAYPIYGRKDPDGSTPTLDSAGGHTGVTEDSPNVGVYHYHLNEQTSVGPRTAGQKQYFLTKGTYHGTPGACTGCN